jgi:hypothetical protein
VSPSDNSGVSTRLATWWRELGWVVPVAAVAAWAVGLVAGRAVVRRWDLDPLTTQGVIMPVSLGALGGLALLSLALLLRHHVLARRALVGVTAGAYSAWLGTTIFAVLNGTPFGFGTLSGDAGRMSAMVMHYSTTWDGTDASDPTRPAEYPPLYAMALGRVAAWTGREGWKLLGTSQAVLVSLSVLVAFLLWRRLVSDVPALLAASTLTLALDEPSKCNELLALAVLVPWLLATFAPPPGRRRLNPVVAGAVAGLMVPWYPNLLMLSLLGVAAIMVWRWWGDDHRRGYLLHAVVTVAVGFVVASWYIVPLVATYARGEKQVVADLYLSTGLSTNPFTVLYEGPPWLYWLQLIGLVGTAVLLRRSWWAPPFALLVGGILLLRVVIQLRFISGGHAFLLYYVPYVLRSVLLVAGVLVLVEVWHYAMSRAATGRLRTPVFVPGAVVVAVVLASAGSSAWSQWAPRPLAMKDAAGGQGDGTAINYATLAHSERLPNGSAPRYAAPNLAPWFPVGPVVDTVQATLGADADPTVLSYDQRLFAFQPWGSYLPPGRTASSAVTQWDDRFAELKKLAATTSPDAFAQAAARTAFGPIEVFVLKKKSSGWYYRDLAFAPNQFSPASFTVTEGLPNDTVVAVRRP